MSPPRKSKRQAKPPAKLNEFLCEENVEKDKDGEPRRSRRTPKLSEKLKSYMDNKGSVKKEKPESPPTEQTSKKASKSASPTKLAQSSKTGQPRVILQQLPRSVIQATSTKGSKSSKSSKSSPKKVPILGKSRNEKKKSGKVTTTSVIVRASPSTSNSKAGNMAVKRKLEMDKSAGMKSSSVEIKRRKTKPTEKQTVETAFTGISIGDREDELIPQVNKDILNKLIGFGAEIAEAIDSNSEAIVSLSTETNKPRRNILESIKADKPRDLTDEDVNAILKWLDEEEDQRRAYRKRILESLRASHEINMALYNQMLQVLQSVTLSV